MVRGLYTSTAGALVAQATIDNIANNLANVSTNGFKRTLLEVEAQPSNQIFRYQNDPGHLGANRLDGVPTQESVGQLGSGSQVFDTPAVFEQGQIKLTGNPLNFALSGTGFFAVRTTNGQLRYTRDGAFVRAANGNLETQGGDTILNAGGQAIPLPAVGKIEVGTDGTINVDGATTGQIAVTEFNNTNNLRPEGSNNFIDVNGTAGAHAATNTTVLQYASENSNSDVVHSIVDLITAERWFDANEKSIQTQDDATNQAITTVGRTNLGA